ncbi:SAM-dependent methyltransferase, BioC-like protein [Devosia sp. LC5]|uniref:methyltransferase domain-containing protein n=1 Tax=Devosia sp. LC5 TaxID=1502724 RepID=UPI0004E46B8B|nr:methyltransferase domain-containing protein [Devosia sp. LC5]KFC66062.1 SAM-dependent methyltransferase, BioC-like protein [Devosia sp. LC5]
MANPPKIFDTALIAAHLARRAPGANNFVMDLVLGDLEDRIGTLIRDFPRALIIGPDIDTLPITGQSASASFTYQRLAAFAGPDDLTDLPEGPFDLIVSLLHLQAVNDVPGYIARLRAILAPDGLLTIAALGGDTLTELREAFLAADSLVTGGASARVAPMIQVRDAGGLLQRAGLALPVADVETHIVRYANPFALMSELKALGAANPLADRPRRLATPALLAAAASAYAERDADPDGRIRATLDIIWLSGWAPHESQQKPLKPGSATSRLGDVLKG